jgi:hypothetical protein
LDGNAFRLYLLGITVGIVGNRPRGVKVEAGAPVPGRTSQSSQRSSEYRKIRLKWPCWPLFTRQSSRPFFCETRGLVAKRKRFGFVVPTAKRVELLMR